MMVCVIVSVMLIELTLNKLIVSVMLIEPTLYKLFEPGHFKLLFS